MRVIVIERAGGTFLMEEGVFSFLRLLASVGNLSSSGEQDRPEGAWQRGVLCFSIRRSRTHLGKPAIVTSVPAFSFRLSAVSTNGTKRAHSAFGVNAASYAARAWVAWMAPAICSVASVGVGPASMPTGFKDGRGSVAARGVCKPAIGTIWDVNAHLGHVAAEPSVSSMRVCIASNSAVACACGPGISSNSSGIAAHASLVSESAGGSVGTKPSAPGVCVCVASSSAICHPSPAVSPICICTCTDEGAFYGQVSCFCDGISAATAGVPDTPVSTKCRGILPRLANCFRRSSVSNGFVCAVGNCAPAIASGSCPDPRAIGLLQHKDCPVAPASSAGHSPWAFAPGQATMAATAKLHGIGVLDDKGLHNQNFAILAVGSPCIASCCIFAVRPTVQLHSCKVDGFTHHHCAIWLRVTGNGCGSK